MEINVEFNSVDLIGWVGTTMIVFGYYFNAKKLKTCFIIWGLGNVAFLIYALLINAPPQVAISIFVIGMNFYGYREWSKND
tara:strand:+ start:185 stop:427 length:243 start_codon:yes stop_codon:yes gene_type:complete